jgi:Lar family restriction alleviation protein
MKDELKPCPFCGLKQIDSEGENICISSQADVIYQVLCERCDASTGLYDHKYEAIKAWNTRSE